MPVRPAVWQHMAREFAQESQQDAVGFSVGKKQGEPSLTWLTKMGRTLCRSLAYGSDDCQCAIAANQPIIICCKAEAVAWASGLRSYQ